jgi:hypothetical protein
MRLLQIFILGLLTSWPTLALAEGEVSGGYRGISSIYYTFIWVVLSYGLYDAFGKKAFYIGAPILAVIAYFALPHA